MSNKDKREGKNMNDARKIIENTMKMMNNTKNMDKLLRMYKLVQYIYFN